MLGLLGRIQKKVGHSVMASTSLQNYTHSVAGYNPSMDECSSEFMTLDTNQPKIHESYHGTPSSVPDTIPSRTECLDMLGLSDEETDDSGCQCPSIREDSSSHDSSFHDDSLLADNCPKDQENEACSNCTNKQEQRHGIQTVDYIEEVEDSCHGDSEEEDKESESDEDSENSAEQSEDDEEKADVNEHNQTVGSDCEDNEEGGWIASDEEGKASGGDSDGESSQEPFNLFDQDIEYDADSVVMQEESGNDSDNAHHHQVTHKPTLPPRHIRRGVVVGCYPPKRTTYSRQMGVQNHQSARREKTVDKFNDSFNWFEDDNDEAADLYNMMNYCSTAPSVKQNSYAFPRVLPDDILDVIEFWENDFQVDRNIIPRMGAWENLGIEPKRTENFKEYQQFITYKTLHIKWVHCNESKDQWYRKYGWSSLKNVLYIRPQTQKIYPEECKPIRGLAKKLETFELYYGCSTIVLQ